MGSGGQGLSQQPGRWGGGSPGATFWSWLFPIPKWAGGRWWLMGGSGLQLGPQFGKKKFGKVAKNQSKDVTSYLAERYREVGFGKCPLCFMPASYNGPERGAGRAQGSGWGQREETWVPGWALAPIWHQNVQDISTFLGLRLVT